MVVEDWTSPLDAIDDSVVSDEDGDDSFFAVEPPCETTFLMAQDASAAARANDAVSAGEKSHSIDAKSQVISL